MWMPHAVINRFTLSVLQPVLLRRTFQKNLLYSSYFTTDQFNSHGSATTSTKQESTSNEFVIRRIPVKNPNLVAHITRSDEDIDEPLAQKYPVVDLKHFPDKNSLNTDKTRLSDTLTMQFLYEWSKNPPSFIQLPVLEEQIRKLLNAMYHPDFSSQDFLLVLRFWRTQAKYSGAHGQIAFKVGYGSRKFRQEILRQRSYQWMRNMSGESLVKLLFYMSNKSNQLLDPCTPVILLDQQKSPSTDLIHAWKSIVEETPLESFTPNDLSSIFISFSHLMYFPRSKYFNLLIDETINILSSVKPASSVDVLTSIISMYRTCFDGIETDGLSTSGLKDGAQRDAERRIKIWIKAMCNLDLSALSLYQSCFIVNNLKIAKKLGILKIQDDMFELFISKYCSHMEENITNLSPKQLFSCLYDLAILKQKPSESFMWAWFEAATKFTSNNALEPYQLFISIYACNLLRIVPPQNFVNAWMKMLAENIQNMPDGHLANIVTSMESLSIRPSSQLAEAMISDIAKRVNRLNSLDAMCLSRFYDMLGLKCPENISKLLRYT